MAVAAATSQVNARIDSNLKASGDAGLAAAGYTTTQAIRALWAFAARWASTPEVISRVLGLAPADAEELDEAERPRQGEGDVAAAASLKDSAAVLAPSEASGTRRMSAREIDAALLAAIGGAVPSRYAERELEPEGPVQVFDRQKRLAALRASTTIVDDTYRSFGLEPPTPLKPISDEELRELEYEERGWL